MTFCSNCGAHIDDNEARFCSECGAPIVPSQVDNDPDIGIAPVSQPVKRHKGTIITSIFLALGWGLFAFLAQLFADSTGMRPGDNGGMVLLAMAFVCVPVAAVGSLIVLIIKKINGPMEKLEKSNRIVIHFISWTNTSIALVAGFANVMSKLGDLVVIVSVFLMLGFCISYIMYVFQLSKECGKEGMFTLLTSYFISFLPAILIGFLLGKLFAAAALLFVLAIVGAVFFFSNGGFIIRQRR